MIRTLFSETLFFIIVSNFIITSKRRLDCNIIVRHKGRADEAACKKTRNKLKKIKKPHQKTPKTTTKQKTKQNKQKKKPKTTPETNKKTTNNFYNHNSLFKGNFQPHFLMNRALFLFAVCETLTTLGCVYVYPCGLSQKVFTVSKAE